MNLPDDRSRSLQWLDGVATVADGGELPFMACASKSVLTAFERPSARPVAPMRVSGPGASEIPPAEHGARERARGALRNGVRGRSCDGLRLIINDDHGMTPTLTIVNRTDAPVTLRAVHPSLLRTEHGTYDLDALLAAGHPTIEPGVPRVLRITDIGRNAGEPFRISVSEPATCPSGG